MEIKNHLRQTYFKKNIFFEIGLMLALGTILFAFEWKVSESQPADFITVSEIPTEIEMVPVTMMRTKMALEACEVSSNCP